MSRADSANQELPIPEFYRSENAASWSFRPDPQALAEAAETWRLRHRLIPAAEDRRRIHLLLVDLQRDFCLPDGALYVGGRTGRGAVEDCDRIARLIYRNLHRLTSITCTLDTHQPFQIFFPAFWHDAAGRPLEPWREITVEQVRAGSVRPNAAVAPWVSGGDVEWLSRQAEFYCAELERVGKYRLYLWPPHCLMGTEGHALSGVVGEARLFHAFARAAENPLVFKGDHPLTENYSVFAPEVLTTHDGRSLAERNQALLDRLLAADALLIAGEAASHCVKASGEDLLAEIRRRDPALAHRVYLLTDCMSAVAVPDRKHPGEFLADFTPQAEVALEEFAAAGMHLVRSTEALAWWPIDKSYAQV